MGVAGGSFDSDDAGMRLCEPHIPVADTTVAEKFCQMVISLSPAYRDRNPLPARSNMVSAVRPAGNVKLVSRFPSSRSMSRLVRPSGREHLASE